MRKSIGRRKLHIETARSTEKENLYRRTNRTKEIIYREGWVLKEGGVYDLWSAAEPRQNKREKSEKSDQ